MICHNEAMGGKSVLTTYKDFPFNNIQKYWHIHCWDDVRGYEYKWLWRKDNEVADQLPFQIPFSYLRREGG